jgi:hypothetical protein
MNWNRGLLRLWIVFSLIWIPTSAICVVDSILTSNRRLNPNFGDLVPLQTFQVLEIVMIAFLPPIAVILGFLVLRWIVRGFRFNSSSKP